MLYVKCTAHGITKHQIFTYGSIEVIGIDVKCLYQIQEGRVGVHVIPQAGARPQNSRRYIRLFLGVDYASETELIDLFFHPYLP